MCIILQWTIIYKPCVPVTTDVKVPTVFKQKKRYCYSHTPRDLRNTNVCKFKAYCTLTSYKPDFVYFPDHKAHLENTVYNSPTSYGLKVCQYNISSMIPEFRKGIILFITCLSLRGRETKLHCSIQ